MKKIYSTIAILAISSLALLSSCSNDKKGSSVKPASPDAVVSLNETTNSTGSETLYVRRDKMKAVIHVNGVSLTTTELKRIYVYKRSTTISSVGTISNGTYENYNGSGFSKDVNDNYYYDIPPSQKNNASLTLTVTLAANDKSAVSDEYYFVFTDGDAYDGPSDPVGTLLGPGKIHIVYGLLTETTGHRLNNIKGPNSGSFDLVTLTNRSFADPANSKDMNDADAITEFWDKSFSAGTSGTLYVKLPWNFDYVNATDLTLKAAYKAANTEVDMQSHVVAGYMYVAKIRGLDQYVFIKITSNSEEINGTGTGKNNEFMEFSVKK